MKDKINQAFASLEKELQGFAAEIKAQPAGSDPMNERMNRICNDMYSAMSSLRDHIYRVHDHHTEAMAKHCATATHLPKLTASQTEKLLKTCGADGDYTVTRPNISMAKTNKGLIVEATYTPKSS